MRMLLILLEALLFTPISINTSYTTLKNNADGFIEKANGDLAEFNLDNIAANIDNRYEPSFFTGGCFALRADQLYFPTANSATRGGDFTWDYDITRLTTLVGYKPDRNILLKIAVADQDNFDRDFYSFKACVTAAFFDRILIDIF